MTKKAKNLQIGDKIEVAGKTVRVNAIKENAYHGIVLEFVAKGAKTNQKTAAKRYKARIRSRGTVIVFRKARLKVS